MNEEKLYLATIYRGIAGEFRLVYAKSKEQAIEKVKDHIAATMLVGRNDNIDGYEIYVHKAIK